MEKFKFSIVSLIEAWFQKALIYENQSLRQMCHPFKLVMLCEISRLAHATVG